MNYNVRGTVAEMASEHEHKRIWSIAIIVLAFVTVFCTALALISPASALESQAETESGTDVSEEISANEETVEGIVEETEENVLETESNTEVLLEESLASEGTETENEEENISEEELLDQSLMFVQAPKFIGSTPNSEYSNPVGLSKTNEYDSATNQYVITMEAYLDATNTDIYTTKPNDIVLLLDKSGSMEYDVTVRTVEEKTVGDFRKDNGFLGELDKNITYYVHIVDRGILSPYYAPMQFRNGQWQWQPRFSGYQPITQKPGAGKLGDVIIPEETTEKEKVEILRASVLDFLEKLKKNAVETGIEHRVDIVTFDTEAREAYARSNGGYGSRTTSYGFLKINGTNNDDYNTLRAIVSGRYNNVDNLAPDGGTDHAAAISFASGIINDSSKTRKDAKKAVILFTDGEPDAYRNSDDIRRDAISGSKVNLKDKGVDVYTIGLFDDNSQNARKLVDLISSDYPDATNMSYTHWPRDSKEYSFSQTSGETLQYNFGVVADTILGKSQVKIENKNNAFIKDIVTTYFEVKSVEVFDKGSDGNLTENASVAIKTLTNTPTDDQTTVEIGEFNLSDYKKNEKHLVVKIYTSAKGNPVLTTANVYSNAEGSGLYKSDTDAISYFDNPTVDVYGFTVNYLNSDTDAQIQTPYTGWLFYGTKYEVSATDIEGYDHSGLTQATISETNTNINFYYIPHLSDTNITYSSTDFGKVQLLSPSDSACEDSVTETGKIGTTPVGAKAVPDKNGRFIGWFDEKDELISTATDYTPEMFSQETTYLAKFEADTYKVKIENSLKLSEGQEDDEDHVTRFKLVVSNISSTDLITYTSLASDSDIMVTTGTNMVEYTFNLHTKGENVRSVTFTLPNHCKVSVEEISHDGYYVNHIINDNPSEISGDKSETIPVEGQDVKFEFINFMEYYELPHTGGCGTMWMTVSGFMIMVLAATSLVIKKKYTNSLL